MAEKTRYSDAELEEFRAIINEKLELAQRDYEQLKLSLMGLDGNDTDDTSPTYKVLEEGANTLSKEETTRLAQRQLKFIQGLQAALVRIENKTYGICRETGKLIPAERLRASCYTEHRSKEQWKEINSRLRATCYKKQGFHTTILCSSF